MKSAWIGPALLVFIWVSILPLAAGNASGKELPQLLVYQFKATETKVIPGNSGEKHKGFNCTGTIGNQDRIGRLAIVSQFYQNGCYTDGTYNHKNYKVVRGEVSAKNGKGKFDAYRIHPPGKKAKKFLGSKHGVFYKFPTREPYTIYILENGSTRQVATVGAKKGMNQRPVKVGLVVSTLAGPATYIFVPSKTPLSSFSRLAKGVEGALLGRTQLADVSKYRYQVRGVPYDTILDFQHGPAARENIYSNTRRFFLLKKPSGELGILWQDKKSFKVYATWLGGNLMSSKSSAMPMDKNHTLAAATFDGKGNFYYLTVQKGDGAKRNRARKVRIYKVSPAGKLVKKRSLDAGKKGLNIISFGSRYNLPDVASMRYSKGKLGVMIGRTMLRSADGLNHQGGIALVLDAASLKLVKNHGQTSGHSFENVLTVDSRGNFAGIDLGDNYPRGVNMHIFDPSKKDSRVVFTFKTKHGTQSKSPAGRKYKLYSSISKNGQKYYRWSNDNRTYTELGGLVPGKNGYTVIFAGEPYKGRALANQRSRNNLNDSRNIGFLRVRPNFRKIKATGNEVSSKLILSKGAVEKGGFFTFGGTWSKQRNTGVIWLTRYSKRSRENASRIKALGLRNDTALLIWEKWTPDRYVETYAMKIDRNGKILKGPVALGSQVRLNRRGDAWAIGNKVYLLAGNSVTKSLELIVMKMK